VTHELKEIVGETSLTLIKQLNFFSAVTHEGDIVYYGEREFDFSTPQGTLWPTVEKLF